MLESGYYPPGAEFDPDAPWNQTESEKETCEECDGTGRVYFARDVEENDLVKVSEAKYQTLSDDEDSGCNLIKDENYICPECGGTGLIEIDY